LTPISTSALTSGLKSRSPVIKVQGEKAAARHKKRIDRELYVDHFLFVSTPTAAISFASANVIPVLPRDSRTFRAFRRYTARVRVVILIRLLDRNRLVIKDLPMARAHAAPVERRRNAVKVPFPYFVERSI
jgi:hypothetical protein